MTDWIEVNRASLRYELSGQGRVPVVLVHEMGGSLESWDDVIPALSGSWSLSHWRARHWARPCAFISRSSTPIGLAA